MTIQELEQAVSHLSPGDYATFRAWFEQYDLENWDAQIVDDSKAGRLDGLVREALEEYNAGDTTDLIP